MTKWQIRSNRDDMQYPEPVGDTVSDNPASRVPARRMIRRAFDAAAASYEESAVLEAEVLDRHLQRFDILRVDPSLILDAGCGSGRAIAPLHRQFPDSTVLAADFSEGMLALLPQDSALPLCADICELPLTTDSVDIVFSNLALQWVPDLDLAFAEIRRVLKPRGLLSFTSYGPDTLIELRSAWSAVDGDNHVIQFFDMHDVGDALIRNGFAEPVMDVERFTLRYDKVDKLLTDLRETGAYNATSRRPPDPTGGDRIKAMTNAYEMYRVDGKLPATFEIVYGHAWAPAIKTERDHDEFRFPVSGIGRRSG